METWQVLLFMQDDLLLLVQKDLLAASAMLINLMFYRSLWFLFQKAFCIRTKLVYLICWRFSRPLKQIHLLKMVGFEMLLNHHISFILDLLGKFIHIFHHLLQLRVGFRVATRCRLHALFNVLKSYLTLKIQLASYTFQFLKFKLILSTSPILIIFIWSLLWQLLCQRKTSGGSKFLAWRNCVIDFTGCLDWDWLSVLFTIDLYWVLGLAGDYFLLLDEMRRADGRVWEVYCWEWIWVWLLLGIVDDLGEALLLQILNLLLHCQRWIWPRRYQARIAPRNPLSLNLIWVKNQVFSFNKWVFLSFVKVHHNDFFLL